jgi:hypothetical protein
MSNSSQIEVQAYHESVIVRTCDGDRDQRLIDSLQDLTNSFTLLAILIHFDQFVRDLDRRAELDNGSRAELVSVKVVHTARDDLDTTVGIFCKRTESHDSDTSWNLLVKAHIGSKSDIPFKGSNSVLS